MTFPVQASVASAKRALVIGTGLIGGSLGKALRRRGWYVSGFDADEARAHVALTAGALDAVGDDPSATITFIATPVSEVVPLARKLLAESDRPDTVVTDVSGVKGPIARELVHPRFVGGHPMAGSEQIGLDGADPDLFVGATWVLTPTATTDSHALARVHSVVTELGADVVALTPDDHDRLVAMVSHVPHLVAATLMNEASAAARADTALLRLAAGGFRDMTRVAAGQPSIWPDVCVDNADAIVAALDQLLVDLRRVRDRVAGADRAGILEMLHQASVARRALPGAPTRPDHLAELRVPVPDRLGVLAELTTLATGLGVNIVDIEVAHSAEGQRGVLVMLVDADRARALREAIAERGYACTVGDLS